MLPSVGFDAPLPLLAFGELSLGRSTSVSADLREQWRAACARGGEQSGIPPLPKYKSMRRPLKDDLIYDAAREDDEYFTPYTHSHVETLLDQNRHSIEHVVPQSHYDDRETAIGPRDPNGWLVAERRENSVRNNDPLLLWPELNGPFALGHYDVPEEERARVARKWLYTRFQYAHELRGHPPSRAQRAKAAELCAWALNSGPSDAELRMNDEIFDDLSWSNPLICEHRADRAVFLDNPEFRHAIFGQ